MASVRADMSRLWLAVPLAGLVATLAARGETPAAFAGRCIPPDCVAPPSNIPDILRRRALSAGRLARLGATRAFHHGLLSAQTVRPPRVVEAAVSEPRVDPVRDPGQPAVFIVGDRARHHGPGEGWGDFLAPFFDERRIQILNWALENAS